MTTTQQQAIKASSDALPSDGLRRFIGWSPWAAIASGLAMIVSLLLEWLVVPHERLGPQAFLTSSYSVSSGLHLLSIVLLVWGLIGIYGRQSRVAGTSTPAFRAGSSRRRRFCLAKLGLRRKPKAASARSTPKVFRGWATRTSTTPTANRTLPSK
jgi:hypothetical protein